MVQAIGVDPGSVITRASTGRVAEDVTFLRTAIVNLFFYGAPGAGDREWVLIDTGMPGSGPLVVARAEELFGKGSRPAAIVMTHGHFDHVGSLRELSEAWDVDVYAHPLEIPYLTGRSAYPPPDPSVGGGAMARLSFLYPRGPFDAGGRVRPLPADGSVPGMPGWRWIATPGHSPGHVAYVRDADRTLLAGDAFITTTQESALSVLTQRPEVHGPPAYYTPDWEAARHSVELLADLAPEVAATGHGPPMRGEEMRRALRTLAWDFERLAVPRRGRYVGRSAVTDENGVVWVPPARTDPLPVLLLGAAAALLAGVAVARIARSRGRPARRREYQWEWS